VISDAFVRIECDGKGCRESDEIQLTALARSGSYDDRNVAREIKRMGWHELPDDRHLCESCATGADDNADDR
jgi:hypothetical protein